MAGIPRSSSRVTWLILMLGTFLVAGSAVLWDVAPSQRVVAAGLGMAGAFVAGVGGDLMLLWRRRLVQFIDRTTLHWFSSFEREYREHVLAGQQYIDLNGLATRGPFTPELDDVFVDVVLVPRALHQVQSSVVVDVLAESSGRRQLSDLIGRPTPSVVAVVGGPGSGKTTLLRHTARQACKLSRSARAAGRSLPILLYLRDHATAIVADGSATIPALLRDTLGDLGSHEPQGWFEQQLRGGRCVVLLDGLDEVPQREDRAKVAAWAERQIRQYRRNDFVITSRPHGYDIAGVDGAVMVQVCGFTIDQASRFIHGWYRAIERYSTRADGESVWARAEQGAEDLLHRLENAPALYDLTVNPLLLTMIATVHRERGALPGSRAELYSEICQVMLWRRQEAKNIAFQMAGDKKETVLRALAYAMMKSRISVARREDVLSEIAPTLVRVNRSARPEDLLGDLSANGLLVERETATLSFAHQTFQEYLAAAYIREKGLVSDLISTVDDPWWRETTLLYAARADADPIVRACLDSNTISALALAFDCAAQASELDLGLRARLDELLTSESEADPARRRLAAGVLLTRHLQQHAKTADGIRLFTQPVSGDIYRLFLADTQTPFPDAPVLDPPARIAVGMRDCDAAAFAGWATMVTGGSSAYRLPSAAALGSAVSLPGIPLPALDTAWCEDDCSLPRLRSGNPPKVTVATLASSVRRDIARSVPTSIRLLTVHALSQDQRWRAETELLDLVLARELALARAIDLAETSHYESALARADGLDRAMALAFQSTPNAGSTPAARIARELAGDWLAAGHSTLDQDLDRHLARDLGLSRRIAEVLGQPDAASRSSGYEGLSRVIEPPLSVTLEQALTEADSALNWPDRFSNALMRGTDDHAEFYPLAPDALAGKLAQAVGTITRRRQRSQSPWSNWATFTAMRLADNAGPVFRRQQRATPDIAIGIRLAALCLAREAVGRGRADVVALLREVAAGITWLERRHGGEDPAPEVIFLATD